MKSENKNQELSKLVRLALEDVMTHQFLGKFPNSLLKLVTDHAANRVTMRLFLSKLTQIGLATLHKTSTPHRLICLILSPSRARAAFEHSK